MNHGWFGVPPLGGSMRFDQLKPELQTDAAENSLLLIEERRVRLRVRVSQNRGSWSQCMRKIERGLSMNRGSSRQVLECASLLVFWRFGDGGEPTKSARGLAQSKTLPRNPQVQGPNACANSEDSPPSTDAPPQGALGARRHR